MDDIIQSSGIVSNLGNVDDAANVDTAVADEYANPGFQLFYINSAGYSR